MTVARAGEALAQYDASLSSYLAITMGSDVVLPRITRGVYIGGAGNLEIIGPGDVTPVTLTGLAVGVWHPMQVQTIVNASTTATLIIAGF